MTKDKAIELAITALDYQANEIYEGGEYDDPDIQIFVNEQLEAIEVVKTL